MYKHQAGHRWDQKHCTIGILLFVGSVTTCDLLGHLAHRTKFLLSRRRDTEAKSFAHVCVLAHNVVDAVQLLLF